MPEFDGGYMALNKKIASALLAVAVAVSAAPNAFAAPIELNIGSADDGSVIDDGKGTDVSLSVGVFSDESDKKSIAPVTPVAGVAEVTDADDASDADVEETVTVEDGIDYVMATKIFRKFESLNLSMLRDELRDLCTYLRKTFGANSMKESIAYLERLQKLY